MQLLTLRSLRLGQHEYLDLEPLGLLVALEHLQIVVRRDAEHCLPLRKLTRLRELEIMNGWVCDLVGFLPNLETLVWETDSQDWKYDPRRTLWRRCSNDHDTDGNMSLLKCSRLRQVVIRGAIEVNRDDPSVRWMLEGVTQVEVCHNYVKNAMAWITELRHLKQLAFQAVAIPWMMSPLTRPMTLACADSLEELFFKPRGMTNLGPPVKWKGDGVPGPLPLWFADHFPNLRVLACPFNESMAVLGPICPRLTHVILPFRELGGFPSTSRESLSRLCVVSLAMTYECTWLRQERGPGRALPSLQRIFHPTTDCLSNPIVCQRHDTVGSVGSFDCASFVAHKMLSAPWSHDGVRIAPRPQDEYFHWLVASNASIQARGSYPWIP